MKKKSLVFVVGVVAIVIIVAIVLAVTLPKKDKGTPSKEQWGMVGISSEFNVAVNGKLEKSVAKDGEVSMKWTNSDETSLDNIISWLKSEGFDSNNGMPATKEILEGGNMISYTAQKTGTAIASSSRYPIVVYADSEKTFIAEVVYITKDFSIMGTSFKAGEIYFDVSEYNPEPISGIGILNAWPEAQIQNVIGESIPRYTGDASGYQMVDSTIGFIKNVQITVFDADESSVTAYNAILAQNGYVLNDDMYEKMLENGDVIQIIAVASMSYHPSTFQMVDVVSIIVTLEKNSGKYTSWDQVELPMFDVAGIPSYSGGASFDLDDAIQSTGGIDFEEYEQIVNSLGSMEGFLDEESRAELEFARLYLQYASQIEAYVVTVYGTNESEALAYENAIKDAGFVGGLKNTTDYQFQVEVSEEDGKAMIVITKVPIQIADEIVDDNEGGEIVGGNEGGENYNPPVDTTLSWENLPTNLKVTYQVEAGGTTTSYTITKIDKNYLIDFGAGIYSYLKYDNGKWTEYLYYAMEWTESDAGTHEEYFTGLSTLKFIFENDNVAGTKGEDEQVAGKNCSVYSETYGEYGSKIYKVNEQGYVFWNEYSMYGMSYVYKITLWDTSVTTFDVTPPQ